MRCHSQAITLKLKKDLPVAEIESILVGANDWVLNQIGRASCRERV